MPEPWALRVLNISIKTKQNNTQKNPQQTKTMTLERLITCYLVESIPIRTTQGTRRKQSIK